MNIDADVRPRTHPRTRPWNRRAVSLAVPGAILLALLLTAPDVPLVIFAGILVAVLISAGGSWIAKRVGISRRLGIGVFLLLTNLALVGGVPAFVPAIMEQVNAFAEQAPAAVETLRQRVADLPWLERLLAGVSPSTLASGESGSLAAGAVSSTFGTLGNLVIVLFIGLFGALDPDLYRRGVQSLLAPSLAGGPAQHRRPAFLSILAEADDGGLLVRRDVVARREIGDRADKPEEPLQRLGRGDPAVASVRGSSVALILPGTTFRRPGPFRWFLNHRNGPGLLSCRDFRVTERLRLARNR